MARSRFRRLIDAQKEAKPRLPYVHTLDAYHFNNALEDGAINPPPCKLFANENLLYLFYGRPSYRVNEKELPSSLKHYLPVCFLFRNSAITKIKRVFPFVSGAFAGRIYTSALHEDMDLADFALEPKPSTPGKVISLFYGSLEPYLFARPMQAIDIDAAEMEAAAYHALISQRLSNVADDRASAIEIQLEGKLDFRKSVDAVVLPNTIADSKIVRQRLKAMKAEIIAYDELDRRRPNEYVTQIFDLCIEFYKRRKFIQAAK
jgi:hypothetical protein